MSDNIDINPDNYTSDELYDILDITENTCKQEIIDKTNQYIEKFNSEGKRKLVGFFQKVKEIRIDDDQDSLWMSVDIGNGSSCHVGYKSCFYRSIPLGKIKEIDKVEMDFKEKGKKFDPSEVYKGKPNPTKI